MSPRTLAIVNPASGGGRAGRRFDAVVCMLRDTLGPLEVERTRGPRDAERLAREGARAGIERILVAGGDGTLSEVATGLLGHDLASYVKLALLPLGTGGDFVRGLGLPREPEAAARMIANGASRPIDAGRVTYRGRDGAEVVSYFVNVSSFGISGLTNELVNESPKLLGGTLSFLWGAIRSILRFSSERVSIRVDGVSVHDAPLVLAAGANGRYFGGGMQVAPDAVLDDGLLDVVVVSQLPKPGLLRLLAKGYRGTHIGHPAVSVHRGRVIEAEAPPGTVKLELDGEPLGTLPARLEVLPGALSLIGPPA